jgi:hypothetical protein
MKKIRLNVADLDATEVLSRDQLKAVFGGIGSSGSENPPCTNSECSAALPCCNPFDSCVHGYCKNRYQL